MLEEGDVVIPLTKNPVEPKRRVSSPATGGSSVKTDGGALFLKVGGYQPNNPQLVV